MPKLRLVGQNVSASRSPFCLVAYLPTVEKERSDIITIDLLIPLEPVVRIESDGVDPGEWFEYESEIEGVDLRLAQWAPRHDLRGRFRIDTLQWGDAQLLREPGIV